MGIIFGDFKQYWDFNFGCKLFPWLAVTGKMEIYDISEAKYIVGTKTSTEVHASIVRKLCCK